MKEKFYYTCNYCEDESTCEYAWDPYNKERTLECAQTKVACLATK